MDYLSLSGSRHYQSIGSKEYEDIGAHNEPDIDVEIVTLPDRVLAPFLNDNRRCSCKGYP